MENTIQFIQVTPEHLTDMITKGVLAIMNPPKEQEELLTQTEVAAFYKVSKPTIIKWQREGRIRVYSIDSERRYKKSELLDNLILMK